jgi:hypothetical protein
MSTLYVNDGLAIVQRNLGLTAADGALGLVDAYLVDAYIVPSRNSQSDGRHRPDACRMKMPHAHASRCAFPNLRGRGLLLRHPLMWRLRSRKPPIPRRAPQNRREALPIRPLELCPHLDRS